MVGPARKLRIRDFASAGLLAGFLTLAAGSVETDSEAEKVASEPSAYNLAAEQLYDEYDANKVAADMKYEGKIVTVTGRIESIGKSSSAYIVIGGTGLSGVQCSFPEGQYSAIARLAEGQLITAKGKVLGQLVGNVLVENCTLQ